MSFSSGGSHEVAQKLPSHHIFAPDASRMLYEFHVFHKKDISTQIREHYWLCNEVLFQHESVTVTRIYILIGNLHYVGHVLTIFLCKRATALRWIWKRAFVDVAASLRSHLKLTRIKESTRFIGQFSETFCQPRFTRIRMIYAANDAVLLESHANSLLHTVNSRWDDALMHAFLSLLDALFWIFLLKSTFISRLCDMVNVHLLK